ncbi:hypothetical protein EL75_4507 [Escherichia coli]|nr:hypothetical protein EL75_4507 [Escherichia coli]KGM76452.1 hypothetical protein EL80_5007 [Escherichia coli]KGM78880.1 hypothetical protein EL79_5012 [Escherichia coli]
MCCNLLKKRINGNADNGIDLLANATGSIGLNKKTERKSPK